VMRRLRSGASLLDKRLGGPFYSFPATDAEGVAQSAGIRLVEDKNFEPRQHAYTIS
jgi:hypothetical protein